MGRESEKRGEKEGTFLFGLICFMEQFILSRTLLGVQLKKANFFVVAIDSFFAREMDSNGMFVTEPGEDKTSLGFVTFCGLKCYQMNGLEDRMDLFAEK